MSKPWEKHKNADLWPQHFVAVLDIRCLNPLVHWIDASCYSINFKDFSIRTNYSDIPSQRTAPIIFFYKETFEGLKIDIEKHFN